MVNSKTIIQVQAPMPGLFIAPNISKAREGNSTRLVSGFKSRSRKPSWRR